MKYLCPSCKMNWEDSTKPLEMLSQPLCIFCSQPHTEKELLNWQMDHLAAISKKDFILVLRNFYRYVENELNSLREVVYEQKKDSR